MLGVRDHILYSQSDCDLCHFYLCRKANLLSSTEVTLFIDSNLQSEQLLTPRGEVACDVMYRLSDPRLRKLATYDLPVKILQ